MNLVIIHWRILSYLVCIPLSLLVSIILTVINASLTIVFVRHIGRINPATFGAAHTFCCSGASESSQRMSSSRSDSLSASQPSWLSFGLSRSPFQLSQFRCLICFLVNYPHHSRQDGGRFVWFSEHSIFDFVLQADPLQTKLLAQVIFSTI